MIWMGPRAQASPSEGPEMPERTARAGMAQASFPTSTGVHIHRLNALATFAKFVPCWSTRPFRSAFPYSSCVPLPRSALETPGAPALALLAWPAEGTCGTGRADVG
eukprot:CAMPEP_0179210998 /NCGR_PEP_ID=MMETSP0797-20121207/119_1 /TAXON_ID=47934 /ORGANISM="Dinophysis acuminata, Strain DAEP01" /LENGTH=105 /DNA_ID=CAMNT_0020916077 /DNA_START=13 /DNA_END=326 /DNA_ORIENTATION=+